MPAKLPQTQHAIQLVGPGELRHNTSKEVPVPGPYQIVARVEAVGLCFSDLKLLKQFSQHARKGEVVRGMPAEILEQIPSYVPGMRPTVPGHEAVCRIVAVGDRVERYKLDERCLVQTDYRTLRTADSNAAFGYNFEGALQEYVLMDERVIVDPETGERFLIPVDEDLSASAVALIEPWACVENSYAMPERREIKHGGRLLVFVEPGHDSSGIARLTQQAGPATLTTVGVELPDSQASGPDALPDEGFDDIVYFGCRRETIEVLDNKLAAGGIINVVTGGRRIGEPVSVGIGRVHYGGTRWIGTTENSPDESYEVIPPDGEIRPGDRIAILGAGGPMGQMHVIRCICQGVGGISVVAADVDEARLASLEAKARPLAERHNVDLRLINTTAEPLPGSFSYFALLAPVGGLVAEAIARSREGAIINIFAGIPASTRQTVDLDTYIANRCFMFGTSGSVVRDMKVVLEKVRRGRLDTNWSVDAVSGMTGAAEALSAVENRVLAGKIVVYPMLHDVGLIPLADLSKHLPSVAALLDNGHWTKNAEAELLKTAAR